MESYKILSVWFMTQSLPFNDHVAEYEEWYEKHPYVFQSELMAIKEQLPTGQNLSGLEIATGTGHFAEALGISEAIEPADNMRLLAVKRGINVRDAVAEHLPYHDLSFDFVVMAFCISYFESLRLAFKEALRVLKPEGQIIVGLLDKDSPIAKEYEQRRDKSVFYKQAIFYSPERVIKELKDSGFKNFLITQTLFNPIDEITELQLPKPGFGEGSFVVIKATKK